VRRGYLALVHGVVADETGEIESPIGVDPEAAHLRVSGDGEGRPARTRFRVVERLPSATLLELELDTGRTHQIRVHLSALGHPLVGDLAYQGEAHPLLARQALHAARLSFLHPLTREPITLRASLPADLAAVLAALQAG
jgi:23S rRNA pseudouridine1911/1915/1917 synthase